MKHALLLGLLGLTFTLSGCGAKKASSADEYYRTASDHFRQGAYDAAAEQYRELLDQHPFSEYSEEAEFRIAHAYYLSEKCAEAVAAFNDFQRRHPTSPHLPLVGYLIGQCYEKQMLQPDRDQSASQNAHAFYLALTQQYPDSPYADLARDRIERCREVLAEHEMDVARFYLKDKNRKAAETRLLDLVNTFNDTDVAGNALFQLGELYASIGDDERAALAYAAAVYHHPDNSVVDRAQRALDQLAEQEDLGAGDPLAALRQESGRTRSLALAQVNEVRERSGTDRDTGFSRPPAPGFGLPGGGYGPFGQQY